MKADLIQFDKFSDHRGTIYYNNEIDYSTFKRFYIIHHPKPYKRAWQYHIRDEKLFFVKKGEFEISWVFPKNIINPESGLSVNKVKLKADEYKLIYLPSKCANSIESLKTDSILMVFSKLKIEDALEEKIRFPSNYW